MQYLTLHELARQFNKPERQLRYRFRELVKEGKLRAEDDFRKEDFVDEFHFAYKINPLRFMDEAKLVLDKDVVTNIVSKTKEVGTNPDTKQEGLDTKENDQPELMGNQENRDGYQSGNNESKPASKVDSKTTNPATKVGTKAFLQYCKPTVGLQ